MRRLWKAFVMCQSMFCVIPFPCRAWDEKARPYMLFFLPVIGLEIGIIWALLAWASVQIELHYLIKGLVICAFPFLATGFMHLDGFMDVTDAVKSWRDLDRRREILKDSHVGSFAVINCILLIVAQFAFASAAPQEACVWSLVFIPVISRCCSVMAVNGLPAMDTSQYAGQKKRAGAVIVPAVMLAAAVVLAFAACGKYGLVTLGCAFGYGLALIRGYRSLRGMNGDISGYSITVGELCGLAIFALI